MRARACGATPGQTRRHRARIRILRASGIAVLVTGAVTGLVLAGQGTSSPATGPGAASTGSGTAPAPTAGPVVSNYERATGATISRDCGYSSPLPGKPDWSLWLFCDTEVIRHASGTSRPEAGTVILGTGTAASGPYTPGRAPSALSEIPAPPGHAALPNTEAPQPFAPAPAGLRLPGRTAPCTGGRAYPAAWISGLTRAPGTGELLVTFDDYCVTANKDQPEGFSIAEYNPAGNILSPPTAVFGTTASGPGASGPGASGTATDTGTGSGSGSGGSLGGIALPQRQVLGSPVIADGYLYLFSYCSRPAASGSAPSSTGETGCDSGGVFLARVPALPLSWQNPFAYQYWTGSGWSAQSAAAVPLPGPGRPLSIAVSDFTADGHGLVMIEQTNLAGAFRVWEAASPDGPWRQILSGQVPCTKASAKSAAGQGAGSLCRALIGHPELSTSDRLLISYFNPGTSHVDVSAFPW